ncbi:hypothetical protein [Methanosarcina acetivorans]|uniref:hypothetical protein n=1 Tax=Methanosarcina acetivorans TaxID=2214 RepID=UPI000AEBC449|nr:hypothetical protein [Methanosarcina acetivorans]
MALIGWVLSFFLALKNTFDEWEKEMKQFAEEHPVGAAAMRMYEDQYYRGF